MWCLLKLTTTWYKVRCLHCPPCCFADSEHDVWSGVGAAASKRGAWQEDCGSGRETGLHPPWCAVIARCTFSSNNKATKRFPGWLSLSCPLPVILPELWVLFSPCEADLSRLHHIRDIIQLKGLTLGFFLLLCIFHSCWERLSQHVLFFCNALLHIHTLTHNLPWELQLQSYNEQHQ